MPRLGGRILSLTYEGHEYLWRNPDLVGDDLRPLVDPVALPRDAGFDQWQNWGGDKTWPGPQGWSGPGEWPGPPDAVLDAGTYEVAEHEPGRRVVLESGYDERSGLRISRDIAVASDGLVVTSTLTNCSQHTVRWAAWEVMQLAFDEDDVDDAKAGVFVDVHDNRAPRVLFSPLGTMRGHQVNDETICVPFADVVGKLGFENARGDVRFRRSGFPEMSLHFTVDGGANYPDGCPFQVWMQTDADTSLPGLEGLDATARLVELEPMSALMNIEPGRNVFLQCGWTFVT